MAERFCYRANDFRDMKRRELLAAMGAGGGLVATGTFVGISLDNEGDQNAGAAASTTNRTTSTATETSTATPTATPTFEPEVTFPSCTSVRVKSQSYTSVFALLADGVTTEFADEYSGTNTFNTESPIQKAVIYSSQGKYELTNPAYETCAATPTRTEAPTQTETETDTPTDTETSSRTPTPTATPPENPQMEISSNADQEGDVYRLEATATNPYDEPYRVRMYATIFFSDTEKSSLGVGGDGTVAPDDSVTGIWTYDRDDADDILRHEIRQTVYSVE